VPDADDPDRDQPDADELDSLSTESRLATETTTLAAFFLGTAAGDVADGVSAALSLSAPEPLLQPWRRSQRTLWCQLRKKESGYQNIHISLCYIDYS
jgi:hypothetical protein